MQVQPATHSDLISMVTDVPGNMKWAVLMSSGGHFAGAVFDKYVPLRLTELVE